MSATREKTDAPRGTDIKLREPRRPADVWDDLEQLINGGAAQHLVWLVLIGLTLVLLIFLVTGFLLATAVLMTTFYFFVDEHHRQLLQQQHQSGDGGDALLSELNFS